MGENKKIIRGWGRKIWENKGVSFGIVGIVFVLLNYHFEFVSIFDPDELPTLAQGVTFFGAIISLSIFFKRLKNQEKQLQHQEEQLQNQEKQLQKQEKQIELQMAQRLDDRFTTAVNLLGSDKTSARAGAIYSLYQLAVEDAKYRSQIAQILCSHVRSNTSEPAYQENHKDRPSIEIQTTINLLVREVNNTKGLYCQDFGEELPPPDFNHAYLVGADFEEAQCKEANFYKAQCQWANFFKARCQNTKFSRVQCQGADFYEAQCQGAKFVEAQCKDTYFRGTQCQMALFLRAQCQGANFSFVQCQGAHFSEAWCQGANFSFAQCQGAHFIGTQCQGTDFSGAQCQGAHFFGAQCQGADFRKAHCKGASFAEVQCQGAYAAGFHQSLSERIGKPTELKEMIIAGEFSEYDIQYIEDIRDHCWGTWYVSMQAIIEENKGKEEKEGVPEGIISGVLEDSLEIQVIISKDWKKLETIWKRKSGI